MVLVLVGTSYFPPNLGYIISLTAVPYLPDSNVETPAMSEQFIQQPFSALPQRSRHTNGAIVAALKAVPVIKNCQIRT